MKKGSKHEKYVSVYHKVPNAYTDDNWKFVATVRVKSYNKSYGQMCDEAFTKTNHIDYSWTENEGVHAYDDNPRSTSVGDYMMIDGQGWSCENHGWSKI
tara:strand:+ start:3458 stop:3754 length:297 start_codon:yes stop_codon:yes gene_type:complete